MKYNESDDSPPNILSDYYILESLVKVRLLLSYKAVNISFKNITIKNSTSFILFDDQLTKNL